VNSFFGTIDYVGANSIGNQFVQVYNPGTGVSYGSSWPQWAFDVAKVAVPTGKTVWIISNGNPFGENLISVSAGNF
jgi:hypothetical protein